MMLGFAPFVGRLAARGLGRVAARDVTVVGRRLSFVKDARGYEHFQSDAQGMDNKKKYSWLLGGFVTLAGFSYYRCIEEVPYTHRRHAIFVSPQQELMMGRNVYSEIKADAQAKGKLVPANHPLAILVRRVGSRIAQVAADGFGGGRFEHLQGADWEFAVIDSPEANAFVVPGGKVVVYSGLLHLLKSEDELAAVLAHEAAHVLARHQGERMSQVSLFTIIKIMGWAFLGINIPTAAAHVGLFLPNSRKAETEADLIGIRLMARACYNPTSAVAMLQKLHGLEVAQAQQTGGRMPAILRTHPLSQARVEAVRRNLPEALRLLEASNCTPAAFEFLQSLSTAFR